MAPPRSGQGEDARPPSSSTSSQQATAPEDSSVEERKKPAVQKARVERKLVGYVMSGNEELQTAVGLYCSDQAAAEATYGEIGTWNTGQVTSMANLFSRYDSNWNDVGGAYCSTYDTFDADISGWDGKFGIVRGDSAPCVNHHQLTYP